MAVDFTAWTESIRRLDEALDALAPRAAAIGVAAAAGQEWHELLAHKLLPQAQSPPLLVVAVAGGTNIGKSVVFNCLAGETASAVSPLAAGTKHPVCLAPPGWSDDAALERLFEGFELRRWQSPNDPLEDSDEHRLYWRVGLNVPERLLLLDTPDIDSDARVNWQRADVIRQSADVLIAVLTQQKYNDAAVKQFFRKAAEADKPVVVVFNQCDLVDDREYWPLWLRTFTEETGARPQLVYVAPYDRRAVAEMNLPIYPVGSDGRDPPGDASSLRRELASLHFDAIKLRTLRGALDVVLDPLRGAPAYLQQVRQAAAGFAAAEQALSTAEMARVQWPAAPAALLVEEIRHWWDARRQPWSRRVHGAYRTLGQGMLWPVRTAWSAINGPPIDPLKNFHERERAAMLEALGKLLGELDRLGRVGNDTLRPRLERLLSGGARQKLLARVEQAHDQLPAMNEEYRRFLVAELDRWSAENPRAVQFLRSLDHVMAVARPAITVTLALGGWFLAGDLVGHTAVELAGQTASNLAAEAAITGGVTGGGEALVTATGEGMKQAAARLFRRLQTRYAEMRAEWLARLLDEEMMGDLVRDMRSGAELAHSAEFRAVEQALKRLHEPLAAATR